MVCLGVHPAGGVIANESARIREVVCAGVAAGAADSAGDLLYAHDIERCAIFSRVGCRADTDSSGAAVGVEQGATAFDAIER